VSDLLTPQAVEKLTGYKRPADQLRELHRLGFWRARRAKVTGDIVLEWPHYDEVTRGHSSESARRPQVRPPKLRAVT
jgi:hypothetical protein